MLLSPVILACSMFTALAAGTAPVAEAGLGVLAYPGDTVVLNATASSDADGETLSYRWRQVIGTPVDPQGGTTAEPSFTIPAAGAYIFELIVSDGTLDSEPDRVAFYVPDRELEPEGGGGCATVSGEAGFSVGGLAMVMLGMRRGRVRSGRG